MPGSTIAERSLLCAALQLGQARSLSSEGSTVPVESEPTVRHEAAMVALGRKAYLMGGRGVQPVEEFDPHADSWTKGGPVPEGRRRGGHRRPRG